MGLTHIFIFSAPFPVDANLAALIVMNLYPGLFEPQTDEEHEEDSDHAALRESDRQKAHQQAWDILSVVRGALSWEVQAQAHYLQYLINRAKQFAVV
jgi:hypothetical protein